MLNQIARSVGGFVAGVKSMFRSYPKSVPLVEDHWANKYDDDFDAAVEDVKTGEIVNVKKN